ncbi:hypothetical protein FOHLNKBM_0473 [Methylobacterium longum]|nr:hypothetical protein FOHLNKBM_0473 [Methylobacterium longum]
MLQPAPPDGHTAPPSGDDARDRSGITSGRLMRLHLRPETPLQTTNAPSCPGDRESTKAHSLLRPEKIRIFGDAANEGTRSPHGRGTRRRPLSQARDRAFALRPPPRGRGTSAGWATPRHHPRGTGLVPRHPDALLRGRPCAPARAARRTLPVTAAAPDRHPERRPLRSTSCSSWPPAATCSGRPSRHRARLRSRHLRRRAGSGSASRSPQSVRIGIRAAGPPDRVGRRCRARRPRTRLREARTPRRRA